MIYGIALLWRRETDSANFPSDVNWPVVIFLLDYLTIDPAVIRSFQNLSPKEHTRRSRGWGASDTKLDGNLVIAVAHDPSALFY